MKDGEKSSTVVRSSRKISTEFKNSQ